MQKAGGSLPKGALLPNEVEVLEDKLDSSHLATSSASKLSPRTDLEAARRWQNGLTSAKEEPTRANLELKLKWPKSS